MQRKKLIRAVERYHSIMRGGHAISVWCLPGRSGREIALYSTEAADLSYPVFRASTVGRIQEAGYEMTQTGKPGHYTLTLPSPPTEEDWQKLDEIFGDPEPITEPMEERN